MLEEVVNSTVNRCISTELMEPSVSIPSFLAKKPQNMLLFFIAREVTAHVHVAIPQFLSSQAGSFL